MGIIQTVEGMIRWLLFMQPRATRSIQLEQMQGGTQSV